MKQFITALRFSFKEQLTNKFAFGLLIIFVPLWYWLLGTLTSSAKLAFKLSSSHQLLHANGHDLTLITAGLNVLSMILGFMFFHSAHRSLSFDRRLTRAGLRQFSFVAAKASALIVTTLLVAVYTILILMLFWHFPNNTFEVWLGFWLVSLIYAALGLLLGMLIDNELVGFFIVIMVSLCDTFLQNPLGNPAANKPALAYLPSYSAMQLGVSGGFTHQFATNQLLLGLGWFVGLVLIGFSIFLIRTKRKGGSSAAH